MVLRIQRKGLFYTTDLLFAVILIMTGILVITRIPFNQPQMADPQAAAESILISLDTLHIAEVNTPTVISLRTNGTITEEDENLSILEYTYKLFLQNQTPLAADILLEVLENITYPYAIRFGTTLIVNTSPLTTPNLIASSITLTGYEAGRKLKGYVATLYLTRLKTTQRTVLLTTGGFTGEGNITLSLELPSDYSSANIRHITWTYQSGTDYTLTINGQFCTSLPEAYAVSKANLTSCAGLFTPGMNILSLTTTQAYNTSYFAGSTLTITYATDTFIPPTHGKLTKTYPRIDGFINLYDGLIIPGTLTSMNITLSYAQSRPEGVNSSIYLTIGNTLVYVNNATNDSVSISNSTLASLLSYTNMSNTTIPIRAGTDGIDELILVESYEPSSTILVTDVSGSMSDCGEYTQPLTCWYYCWPGGWTSCQVNTPTDCSGDACDQGCWFSFFNQLECNRTKLQITQAADHQAIDTLLNYSKNRVGLVAYESGVRSTEDPISTSSSLHAEVDSYYASGGTCICCGIYKATAMLQSETNPLKFILVLSDGDANYKCTGPTDYTGTYVGEGSEASQSTIQAGQYACSQNITVYTVGFGTTMSSQGVSTLIQTACNESLYYSATNMSLLTDIYANISKTILGMSNYSSQIVTLQGAYEANLTNLTISITYDPPIPNYQPYEFPIQYDITPFKNCTATITIPKDMRVYDASLSVYSGEYWTSSIILNGKTQYNLTSYNTTFKALGDPHEFLLNPADFITGNNTLIITIEDAQHNQTSCNENTTLHLTLLARLTAGESSVLPKAEGCVWNITYEDNSSMSIAIPPSATTNCTYTPASYPTDDAYAVAAYKLLNALDFDKNGRIDVNITSTDLTIRMSTRTSIPSLLGPSTATILIPR